MTTSGDGRAGSSLAVPVVPLRLDGQRRVRLDELHAVAARGRPVEILDSARAGMERARELLERYVDEGRLIYGVTTGFGPLATEHVGPDRSAELQRNLVYHLASGVGPPLSLAQTRALMAARLVNLSRGYSAVRPQTAELLAACLHHDLLPVVPSMGTVGASGDLTPLAHVALGLMGEGRVRLRGEQWPAGEALAACGLQPLDLSHKEGLALVNGTSAMTGIAALNAVQARRAFDVALRLAVLNAELTGGRLEAWHPGVASVRPHAGQRTVTARLQRLVEGTRRLVRRPSQPPTLSELDAEGMAAAQPILQDPYTVRCVPQLFGAVHDVLTFHDETVETELNAVTDNPLFFPEEEMVLHGGNFYGQHVAFASDALANAIIKMAIHAERVVARITDTRLNGDLPPFMQPRTPGLQSGFMGAQVTASALLAEMRTHSQPASIQSIPTNANNQDVVTMGTIGARRAAELLGHLFRLLAIEAMVLVQGFELEDGFAGSGFAAASHELAEQVRDAVPFLEDDRPLSDDIERLAHALQHPSAERR